MITLQVPDACEKKKRIIFQFVARGTTKDPLILLVEAEPRIILLPL